MAYFSKYYMEFTDAFNRLVRVDILDSEGIVPASPYQLIGSGTPLTTELLDSGDEKEIWLMGKQITINYIFDGDPNTPLPDVFFEATERRFRVEVRKNGALSGVYFVRPDGSEKPYLHDPYEVSVTAVDGLAYAEGTPFNMYNDDQSLKYEKITLYEAIVERALSLVVDATLPMNVLNSLEPTNIQSGIKLLFGTFVHTDAFYDFVKGASNVKEVLEMFCMSFGCRLFLEDGAIWWQRIEDCNAVSHTVDQYTSDTTVIEITPDLTRSIGPATFFDGIPTNADGIERTTPALKRAEFSAEYDTINVIVNFDYRLLTPDPEHPFFAWQTEYYGVFTRIGAGTIEAPYKMRVPEETAPNQYIQTDRYEIRPGEILELELAAIGHYAKGVYFAITVRDAPVDNIYYLTPSGEWQLRGTSGLGFDRQTLLSTPKRGKKGSFKIKSAPFPSYDNGPFTYTLLFSAPLVDPDRPGGETTFVDVFPVKVGIIDSNSQGRHITAINNSSFSRVKEDQPFKFIDTGDDGISNTLFTGAAGAEIVETWTTNKPGITNKDIERFMAEEWINQAQRSVKNWEGNLRGPDLGLKNIFSFSGIPGKQFIAIRDTLDDRACIHQITVQEVFVEGTAQISYSEYDIEDEEN